MLVSHDHDEADSVGPGAETGLVYGMLIGFVMWVGIVSGLVIWLALHARGA